MIIIFPYIIGYFVFSVFFNADRTQWLKDNDYNGIDWNEDFQKIMYLVWMGITGVNLLVFTALILKDCFIKSPEKKSKLGTRDSIYMTKEKFEKN